MVVNIHSALVSLIQDNWTSSSTDSITPTVGIITDYKRIEQNTNTDWVLVHRVRPSRKAAGIGIGSKVLEDEIDIDLRVFGLSETHFFLAITELRRILDANIIGPFTGYQILDPDGDAQDLSDKYRGIWRLLITIKLINYNTARGT